MLTGTPPTTPIPWPGPFSWVVRDSANQIVPLPAPSPTGSTLTFEFTHPDRYLVTASIDRGKACDPATLTASAVPDVADCDCPTITGRLQATQVDGCTFNFSATVTPAGQAPSSITYEWDFGDGSTSTSPPPLAHTYIPGTSGTRTVTLTVRGDDGCTAAKQVTVQIECGGGAGCPSFTNGITATPAADDPCSFNLDAAVDNPGGAAASVTWELPGGGTASGTTASVTLPPGASATATATLRTPGCTDQTVSTTLICPGGTPPPPPSVTLPTCTILLLVALALMLIGSIVIVIGICTGITWVWIVGAVIAAIGLALFIAWAIVCARSTPCSLMRTLQCILFWMVALVIPVLVVVVGLIGGLGCGIAAALAGVGWGAIYAWLGRIMRAVGCPPIC